jgi:hypothetical protein
MDLCRRNRHQLVCHSWGQFFVHFFPRKITFRGKFRGISWKNAFSKLFPRKIQFFPNIFWGKIFRGIFPEIFPGKMYEKSAPGVNHTISEFAFTTPARRCSRLERFFK